MLLILTAIGHLYGISDAGKLSYCVLVVDFLKFEGLNLQTSQTFRPASPIHRNTCIITSDPGSAALFKAVPMGLDSMQTS